ncbi:hypothetical protein BJ912DRAFT_977326 [Pholiota molesta]|nr:hypothetical protein BJ912DRAFT_977326 [Pholiota molesta]
MFPAILLILSVPISAYVSLTPPTPPAPKEQRRLNDFAIATRISVYICKCFCWIHGVIEILILVLPTVARQFPQSTAAQWANDCFFDYFLPSSLGKDKTIFFPPLRMLGAFLMFSGSTIRYLCYRELGRHFTYHVALLDNHSLVTTGPYNIVRHPSYTGGILLSIGSLLWHSTSGAWLRQSGFYTKPVAWIAIIPTLIGICSFAGMLVRRPMEEDKMLKKEFGKKWNEWARRVPYRLVPGIY